MTPFPEQLEQHLLSELRQTDRDRYLCTLLLPAEKRGLVAALYAFNSELAQVRDRVSDPAAGEVRLAWWDDVVDAIYVGQTVDAPVPQALARAVEAGDLPRHTLKHMIEARRFDLFDDPMPDLNSLEGYLGETSSALVQMSALVLAGYDALQCAETSGYAGVAIGLTGLLRSLPVHRARGQCYIPAAILDRHSLSPSHVLANRGGAGLELTLLQLCDHAQKCLESARAGQHTIPEPALGAYLPAALVPAYLRKLRSQRQKMLEKVSVSPQWLRQLRLLRAVHSESF